MSINRKIKISLNSYVILLSILFVTLSTVSVAQDIIITKKSERINAKVTEVNINDIKYKNWKNLDGPVYTMLKSDIDSITYQNGEVEVFTETLTNNQQQEKLSTPPPTSMTAATFNLMSDEEQYEYLEKYEGGDIYSIFHSGMKLRNKGKGLLAAG